MSVKAFSWSLFFLGRLTVALRVRFFIEEVGLLVVDVLVVADTEGISAFAHPASSIRLDVVVGVVSLTLHLVVARCTT